MNRNSVLFQTISEEQLQMCCRKYLNEQLESAELLEGGLFNTTYRLNTKQRSAILRLGPVNRQFLLPYEQRLMDAEVIVQTLFHKHGIPTSQLLALDTSRTFLDRDIMAVACIPGVSLSNVTVPRETERCICADAGRMVREIHSISPDEVPEKFEKPFGRVAAVLAGMGGSSWSEAICREISLWRSQGEKISLFSPKDFDRFEALYSRFAALLDAGCPAPKLVHADLWYGNLLVDTDGKLLALIDADRAFFGDPQFEFATGWMIGESFCKGYGGTPDPSAEAVLRRRLYKLLLNLEDCYVHLGEYGNPEAGHELCDEVLQELAALENI